MLRHEEADVEWNKVCASTNIDLGMEDFRLHFSNADIPSLLLANRRNKASPGHGENDVQYKAMK